jgi:hypothetical protein
MTTDTHTTTGFAAWHPVKGFDVPFLYEGAIVCVEQEDLIDRIQELNRDDGTNNRNGWRIVRVKIERTV